jgi:hypothetical protein
MSDVELDFQIALCEKEAVLSRCVAQWIERQKDPATARTAVISREKAGEWTAIQNSLIELREINEQLRIGNAERDSAWDDAPNMWHMIATDEENRQIGTFKEVSKKGGDENTSAQIYEVRD